jgi:hypothetical protein
VLLINDASLKSPTPKIDILKDAIALKFNGKIAELSAIVDYNFRDYQSNKKNRNWTPYIYSGLSFLLSQSNNTFQSKSNSLVSGVEEKTVLALGIPFGVGVKYQLNSQWGLQGEFGTTKALNDMLDGYAGPTNAGGSEGFFTLSQTDQNLHLNLSITYSIISIYCPKE